MLDKLIVEFDKMVKTLFSEPVSKRPHPDSNVSDDDFSDTEKKHIIGLMRVNHCGEICAQGLYQGQAIIARDQSNQESLQHASFQEIEHLAWTSQRIYELGGQTSIFNPAFYLGSLVIGVSAGILGDKWSLGFLAETENQVGLHLTKHLTQLPQNDIKSKMILEQMVIDEAAHEQMAIRYGGADLPNIVKSLMQFTSKIMTNIAYKI